MIGRTRRSQDEARRIDQSWQDAVLVCRADLEFQPLPLEMVGVEAGICQAEE